MNEILQLPHEKVSRGGQAVQAVANINVLGAGEVMIPQKAKGDSHLGPHRGLTGSCAVSLSAPLLSFYC